MAPAGSPTSFTVADPVVTEVELFDAPGVPAADGKVLSNPTSERLPVVFLVREQQGEWLEVNVSARPNGRVNWVRAADVVLRTVPNHVLVEVGARRVTVFHGDEVLFETTVAVGTGATPTPIGDFFVDGVVDTGNPGGVYGPRQVSVSGFSEVLDSFDGGVAQIALHGTNNPGLLGQAVSNGCVRMTNDGILDMVPLVPSGTPVKVVS